MMIFLLSIIVSSIAWHILDNYTTIPSVWKWIIVFFVLMALFN